MPPIDIAKLYKSTEIIRTILTEVKPFSTIPLYTYIFFL